MTSVHEEGTFIPFFKIDYFDCASAQRSWTPFRAIDGAAMLGLGDGCTAMTNKVSQLEFSSYALKGALFRRSSSKIAHPASGEEASTKCN